MSCRSEKEEEDTERFSVSRRKLQLCVMREGAVSRFVKAEYKEWVREAEGFCKENNENSKKQS